MYENNGENQNRRKFGVKNLRHKDKPVDLFFYIFIQYLLVYFLRHVSVDIIYRYLGIFKYTGDVNKSDEFTAVV